MKIPHLSGVPTLSDGERYDAVWNVVTDRVTAPNAVPVCQKVVIDRLKLKCGKSRVSQIWVTFHYPVEARTRYVEVCRLTGRDPLVRTLDQLANVRSLLVIAWCIRKGSAS